MGCYLVSLFLFHTPLLFWFERRTKVIDMWKVVGTKGQVERLACWDFILADAELASIMGKGNEAKGKAMLEMMKAVRACDADGDGNIDGVEFQRLYLPSVLVAAEEAANAGLTPDYLLAM